MNTNYIFLWLLGTSTILLLLLAGCGSQTTPELVVKEFVEQCERAAEERNARMLRALIADTYQDQEGRTKKDISSIISGYLLRNKHIHIITKIDSITEKNDRLQARVFAALTASPVQDLSDLPALNADIYLFELTLEQVSQWQLISSTWRQAVLSDIL